MKGALGTAFLPTTDVEGVGEGTVVVHRSIPRAAANPAALPSVAMVLVGERECCLGRIEWNNCYFSLTTYHVHRYLYYYALFEGYLRRGGDRCVRRTYSYPLSATVPAKSDSLKAVRTRARFFAERGRYTRAKTKISFGPPLNELLQSYPSPHPHPQQCPTKMPNRRRKATTRPSRSK